MRSTFRDHLWETLAGLAVVALAVWFVLFAWSRTGGGQSASAIHVTAMFPNASGVSVGTDVRIAGLKVGAVSGQRLDPKTYQAELVLALDPDAKVPADSSASITQEGLLGGTYISLAPGGDPTPLKDGDAILETQGSLDLMSLIGQFINKSGDGQGAGLGDAAGAAPPR